MTKTKIPQDITAYFAKYGREGARKRAKNLSPKRRREIAQKAARARWKKGKKQ
jgi:hypothetical protein